MIVVDTSAWIEYLRRTESPAHLRLRDLLASRPDEVALTEVVVGEVLAGVRDAAVARLRDRLVRFRILELGGLRDFELAASLLRTCRERGEAVRQLTDCLLRLEPVA